MAAVRCVSHAAWEETGFGFQGRQKERCTFMNSQQKILRGQIYYANLDPALGSEQGGVRPVLI